MKKLLFSSLLFSSLLFSYEDLGIYGPLFDISEKNIKIVITEGLRKNKSEIKEMATKAFESGLIFKSSIPYSISNETIKTPATLKNVKTGREIALKDIPMPINDNLCIVNFESFNIFDEIINQFGKSCRYVFLNVDIRKISNNKKYAKIDKYIGNELLFKIVTPKATPVKISLSKEKIIYKYLDYKEIKAIVKQKLLIINSKQEN